MQVATSQGTGLKILAPQPLAMSVLPYTQEELGAARHTTDLPKESTSSELRLAAGVSGLGNGSNGPSTSEPYRVYAVETEYVFIFQPVRK